MSFNILKAVVLSNLKVCGSAGMLATANLNLTLKFNANCLREKYRGKCRALH